MLFFDGFGGLLVLGLWIGCFIDVVVTPEASCRNLPKLAWVFIVLLFPLIGSVAWLIAGHPWDRAPRPYVSSRGSSRLGDRDPAPFAPAARRPARASNPDDDEEFLASLSRRAEEQRRRARERDEHGDTDPR